MKRTKDDWVVAEHRDGSPAIYRKSRVTRKKVLEDGFVEIHYNNGMAFTVREKVRDES